MAPAKTMYPEDPNVYAEKAKIYPYTKIRDMRPAYGDVYFYGLVVSHKQPMLTRKNEWMVALTVIDESLPVEPDEQRSRALSVNMFNADRNWLPEVIRNGDVIQFRHFKIQRHNDTIQAITTKRSRLIIYYCEPDTGIGWRASTGHEITDHELTVINQVTRKESVHSQAQHQNQNTPKVYDSQDPRNRTITISDLRPHSRNFELTAMVYKKMATRNNMTSLLLTDYTENTLLDCNAEVLRGLEPHMQRRVLVAVFWDRFSTFAGVLSEGDVVHLRGCVTKKAGDIFTIALHGNQPVADDEYYIEKLDKKTDKEAIDLVKRKQDLQRLIDTTKSIGFVVDATSVLHDRSDSAYQMPTLRALMLSAQKEMIAVVKVRAIKWRLTDSNRVLLITLEDDTAQLEVALGEDSMATFFSMQEPIKMWSDQVEGRLNRLCSCLVPSKFLIVYYTKPNGSKRIYQVYDTVLTL